jgi:soluble lytic murein transglycosylase-like protein
MRTLRPCLVALILGAPACAPGTHMEAPAPAPRPVAVQPEAPALRRKTEARRPAPAKTPAKPPVSARAPAKASSRVPSVDSTALELAVTTRHAHLALARALARRTRNPAVAERAAWAVTREAGRLKVSPSLLAAVLLVENRALDSNAVSVSGAVGLMQVMPIHAGSYGCASADLRTVDANICHGARILHIYLVRTRSVPRALRRYNGCVSGTVTPGCQRYPLRVLRTAARIRREMLSETRDM